ncbi:MAG: YifB family Mg chelatase-like AAA ATPase [Planctomycetota bacterium]
MGTVRILGACLAGSSAELVTIEARYEEDREAGRVDVLLTGLPDPVIRESRGRLLCALSANGLGVPPGRLYLNLVPAARRKSGEILDLPLLLGAAAAAGHLKRRAVEGRLFLGEVGIDGTLHAVPGGLAAAMVARTAGVAEVLAPRSTALESAWVPGITAFGAAHVDDVVRHLVGSSPLEPLAPTCADNSPDLGLSVDDVRGQASGKLALAVAAHGGHGLLFIGPPGTGKSMLARRITTLLPAPSLPERLDITRVLSASGRWPGGLASARPYRAPHHTVSYAGLVGGGSPPSPGEITLAHCGVLFLDELPEFMRSALEVLRQPLEDAEVTISRSAGKVTLPCAFMLVAALNPCPCGYLGDNRHQCRCTPTQIQRYRGRVSGPLLDRIDLHVEAPALSISELRAAEDGETSNAIRARVVTARSRQQRRFEGTPATVNARMSHAQIRRHCALPPELGDLLQGAMERLSLSARAYDRILKVARTIADLAGSEEIAAPHLLEAIQYRSLDRNLFQ